MVLALKYVNEDTIFISATGDVTTVVILATQSSSCLQGKGGTFISQLFKTLSIYWSSLMNCGVLECRAGGHGYQLSLSCCSAKQVSADKPLPFLCVVHLKTLQEKKKALQKFVKFYGTWNCIILYPSFGVVSFRFKS